jgi:hypothetical protein
VKAGRCYAPDSHRFGHQVSRRSSVSSGPERARARATKATFSSGSCGGRVGRCASAAVMMTPAAFARYTDSITERGSAPSAGDPVEISNEDESRVASIFVGRSAVILTQRCDDPPHPLLQYAPVQKPCVLLTKYMRTTSGCGSSVGQCYKVICIAERDRRVAVLIYDRYCLNGTLSC